VDYFWTGTKTGENFEVHAESRQTDLALFLLPLLFPYFLTFLSFQSARSTAATAMGAHVSHIAPDTSHDWIKTAQAIQVAKFTSVASLSIAVYDYFACLDEEIELICESHRSLP